MSDEVCEELNTSSNDGDCSKKEDVFVITFRKINAYRNAL